MTRLQSSSRRKGYFLQCDLSYQCVHLIHATFQCFVGFCFCFFVLLLLFFFFNFLSPPFFILLILLFLLLFLLFILLFLLLVLPPPPSGHSTTYNLLVGTNCGKVMAYTIDMPAPKYRESRSPIVMPISEP